MVGLDAKTIGVGDAGQAVSVVAIGMDLARRVGDRGVSPGRRGESDFGPRHVPHFGQHEPGDVVRECVINVAYVADRAYLARAVVRFGTAVLVMHDERAGLRKVVAVLVLPDFFLRDPACRFGAGIHVVLHRMIPDVAIRHPVGPMQDDCGIAIAQRACFARWESARAVAPSGPGRAAHRVGETVPPVVTEAAAAALPGVRPREDKQAVCRGEVRFVQDLVAGGDDNGAGGFRAGVLGALVVGGWDWSLSRQTSSPSQRPYPSSQRSM